MTPEIEERIHLLLRQDAVLEGTDYEKEALEYERRPRSPLAPAASAFLRDRRASDNPRGGCRGAPLRGRPVAPHVAPAVRPGAAVRHGRGYYLGVTPR